MPDVLEAAIRAAFPASDLATIAGILDLYGVEAHERERERVQLAMLALCAGSEERLRYLVGVAKTDYRDVLSWVETGPLSEVERAEKRAAVEGVIQRWGKK